MYRSKGYVIDIFSVRKQEKENDTKLFLQKTKKETRKHFCHYSNFI